MSSALYCAISQSAAGLLDNGGPRMQGKGQWFGLGRTKSLDALAVKGWTCLCRKGRSCIKPYMTGSFLSKFCFTF